MRISNKEIPVIAAQTLLFAFFAWRLITKAGQISGTLETVLIFNIFALGLVRIAIRNSQMRSHVKFLKGLQESEKSAHELTAHLDVLTRREIATWIHGDLQRSLIGLSRRLRKEGHSEASDELERLNNEVVRTISHKLYPPQLEVSLHLALTDLCNQRADLTTSDNISLTGFRNLTARVIPFDLRLAVFRIVEEALNNAEKKPNTTKIAVSVDATDALMRISVLDNGEPLSESPTHSLGFTLINTHVRRFDGNWSISNTDSGVLLTASLSFTDTEVIEDRVAKSFVQLRKLGNQ